jgi:hypothetical protein
MSQSKKNKWLKTIAKTAVIVGTTLGILYIIGKIKNETNEKNDWRP